MSSNISAADALLAAALIGTPLVLVGVLGLGWLDDWRHRRQHRDESSKRRTSRRTSSRV